MSVQVLNGRVLNMDIQPGTLTYSASNYETLPKTVVTLPTQPPRKFADHAYNRIRVTNLV
jgi:hypothetical protein